MKNKFLQLAALSAITFFSVTKSKAQNGGSFSGDLMTNYNFYQRDSSIGADNDLYRTKKSGGEGWLSLRYSNYGFTGYLRLDVFNNSNLKDPAVGTGFTGFGIGAWSITKEVKGLTITGGYIYDQIGSGILFRAYEDRGLLIDNALEGLHLKYKIDEAHLTLKAFTGQQKNYFDRYAPIIKGASAEGDYQIGENVHLTPGVGVVNRTLDNTSYNAINATVQTYAADSFFTPVYNTYAFTGYNTLSVGDFTWYVEGAYKTHEAIKNLNNSLSDEAGNVEMTTLGYARKGLALNVTAKRTENFVMRTAPFNDAPNSGMINWQPVVAQIRPQRLMARYTPASQDLSEKAVNGNMLISPNPDLDLTVSGTYINTLDNLALYREGYFEANIRSVKNFLIDVGAQYMFYNKAFYQVKPGEANIKAITPFTEITYLFSSKKSLKVQAQYQNTKQDNGSWAFLQLEYSIAPKWGFAVSDMYNIGGGEGPEGDKYKGKHFYNIFLSRTAGANRFSIAYVKQVDGINCTGGVCRYEPGFSGVKLSITSSF